MAEKLPTPVEVQKYLSGMDYPARRDDLVEHARRQGPPEEVLDAPQRIPDREYDGPNAVSKAVGDLR